MKRFLTIFFAIALVSVGKAQVYNTPTANKQEVFLQLHRPFYVSGEKLWFTLFNYDSKTSKLLTGRRFMQFSLVDRTGKAVLSERIKVYQGRTSGQFIIPSNFATDEYLIHIGFPEESLDQFLYRKKVTIYNRSEVLEQAAISVLSFENQQKTAKEEAISIKAEFAKQTFGPKEKVSLDLALVSGDEANLSVLIRPIENKDSDYIISDKKDFEAQNKRINKSLNFEKVQDHPYLLVDLKSETPLKPEARPLVFIPETHQIKAFYKTDGDIYSLDLTDVPGGVKSLYFNQFLYKRYVSPKADWDFEKNQYQDQVPYYEGDMKFGWIDSSKNFSSIITDITFTKPEITTEVMQYSKQQSVRMAILASGGYTNIPVMQPEAEENPMIATTLSYKKANNYEMMNNVAEYLFEIVGGIRAWDTDNRKDVRVMFGSEMFHDAPLFLVDGIPTRETEKILALPIEDLQGAGVIKFIQSKTRSKNNVEARPYGDFAGSGIVVIHLKPGASNPFRSSFEDMLKTNLYIEPEVYPNPIYSTDQALQDTPDLRQILLWQPEWSMTNSKQTLSFYASDIPGNYELIIQGIDNDGKKVFLRKPFSVELGIE